MSDSFLEQDELKMLGLRSFGKKVLVSRNARIYGAEHLTLGSNVRIDDFSLISVRGLSSIGSYVHISAHTSLFAADGLEIGDFVTLSGRVSIYGQSDDYSGEYLANPMVPESIRNVEHYPVVISDYVIIGTNSTVLPGANLATGTAIGAHSLVSTSTKPWGIYYGVPAKRIKERSKSILNYDFIKNSEWKKLD